MLSILIGLIICTSLALIFYLVGRICHIFYKSSPFNDDLSGHAFMGFIVLFTISAMMAIFYCVGSLFLHGQF